MADSTSQTNNANVDEKKIKLEMIKLGTCAKLAIFTINIILGICAFSLQVWAFSSVKIGGVFERDATGFSCGCFAIGFSTLLTLRFIKEVAVIRAAALYLMILGVFLVYFHCYFIYTFKSLVEACLAKNDMNEKNLMRTNISMCQFATDYHLIIDILMAICGSFIVIVNGIIFGTGSSFI